MVEQNLISKNTFLSESIEGLERELKEISEKYKQLETENSLPVRSIVHSLLECISKTSQVILESDKDVQKQCVAFIKYLKMQLNAYGVTLLYHEHGKIWIEGMDRESPNLFVNYVNDPDLDHTVHCTQMIGCIFPTINNNKIEPIFEELSINIYKT